MVSLQKKISDQMNVVKENRLAVEFWKRLSHKAKSIKLKRHHYIYYVGDEVDKVYFIVDGLMMLTRLLENGREVGQVILKGFNMFGQCEILNNTNRQHQATAITDCQLWSVTRNDFSTVCEESAKLSLNLAKMQSDRLQKIEKKFESFSCYDVETRLMQILLELSQISDQRNNSNPAITPCPTHQDLAIMIASTRETVSNIMGKLRKEKFIDFNRNELVILDRDAWFVKC